jgi:ribonuclease E
MIERSCPVNQSANGRFSNPEESDCMLDTFESPAFDSANEGDARMWDAATGGYRAASPTDSDDPEDEIIEDDLDDDEDDDDLDELGFDDDDEDDDEDDADLDDDEDDDDEDDDDLDDDDLDDDLIDLDDEFDTDVDDKHKPPGHLRRED